MSVFPRPYVPRVLCPPVPMFSGFYVPRYVLSALHVIVLNVLGVKAVSGCISELSAFGLHVIVLNVQSVKAAV